MNWLTMASPLPPSAGKKRGNKSEWANSISTCGGKFPVSARSKAWFEMAPDPSSSCTYAASIFAAETRSFRLRWSPPMTSRRCVGEWSM